MKPHEIESAIDEQVSGAAAEHWNGMDRSGRDELVVVAQRDGLAAALRLLAKLAN